MYGCCLNAPSVLNTHQQQRGTLSFPKVRIRQNPPKISAFPVELCRLRRIPLLTGLTVSIQVNHTGREMLEVQHSILDELVTMRQK
jgi:hypothetical protein